MIAEYLVTLNDKLEAILVKKEGGEDYELLEL